jgi:hypothetical protein
LRYEHLHDCAHALKRVDRAKKIACGKVALYLFKLVQQLLEPQFVRLMDDDEQRLVVFRWARPRLLKGKQFLQIEITGVRERRHS